MAFVPTARHLLRAKDVADARYFEPLGVDDLARAAGLSRAHFSREFRRAFGEPPVMDAETAEHVRGLMAKGFAGTVFLTTDDCRAAYEELKSRGVEFTEQPEERPYGIDSAFRDPSGNSFRLTQVRAVAPA
jgi:AraC-like DNA-binding protein